MTIALQRAILADAALPLVWFTIPAVVMMLIPTILLEGILLKFWLRLQTWQALKVSLAANAASTLAGVPVATLLSYGATRTLSPWARQIVEREHWQSPLGDIVMAIANSSYISAYVVEAHWLLPAALLIILVPAYLLSWLVEYWVARAMLAKQGAEPTSPSSIPLGSLNRAVRRANFVSYALLFSFIAWALIRSQFHG
jgi:hypothetical protein